MQNPYDLHESEKVALVKVHNFIYELKQNGELGSDSILALAETLWDSVLSQIYDQEFFWQVVDSMMLVIENQIKAKEKTLE